METAILGSWEANASAWIKVLEQDGIPSRVLATNAAIIRTVLKLAPARVLDVGCGEGWLCRILQQAGIATTGIDAVQTLLDYAAARSAGPFIQATYESIVRHGLPLSRDFDLAVFNFSLLGKDLEVLGAIRQYLKPGGCLVVQTLHPMVSNPGAVYQSGWRDGSWEGLPGQFVLPYRWYFRTLGDWLAEFCGQGYVTESIEEPLHPESGQPASVIFRCRANA